MELKDLGVGIHLIHGPNETGKSTLISAIARAFFDRYNTQDQEIRSLRPWGTELAPRVTLEFEAQGNVYRLDKRFLDEESSALSEWNGSRFERVADSVKADDRVRGFLLGSASRSGAASMSNWGLARLLWMTQNLATRMSAPGLDETLRQHLLGTLGSAVLCEGEQKLVTGLDQAYDAYYTAAKGSEKKGSPLYEARERLARAEEVLAQCKSKWDEVSRWNESAIDAQSRLQVIESERKNADTEISTLQIRTREELETENFLKVKDQELLALLERWKSLNLAHLEILDLERNLKSHQGNVSTLEPKITELNQALTLLEAQLKEATTAAQASSEDSARLSQELAAAAQNAELRSLAREREILAALETSAKGLEQELHLKKVEYASRKRPKESDLAEVRAWTHELDGLRARIADQGIEVHVKSERPDQRIQWQSDVDNLQSSETTPGDLVFRCLDGGELVIPGFGRITIRSGAEDSKKLKLRLEETQFKIKTKLDSLSVMTLEELQILRHSTLEIETNGQAQRAALNSALSPRFKSVADVSVEIARIESSFSQKLAAAGLEAAAFQTKSAGEEGTPQPNLRERALQAKLNAEAAARARNQLEGQVSSSRVTLDEARKKFDASRQSAELLLAQLLAKLATHGGRENLDQNVGALALEKNSLEQEQAALSRRLPPPSSRASLRLAVRLRERDDIGRREEAARREFDQASALLDHAQGEGYYSKLAAAEEERAMAIELLSRRLAQAQGARVLRSLAHAKRERMNSGLLAPIESKVSAIFQEIRGEKIAPLGLTLSHDLEQVSVNAMSGAKSKGGGETKNNALDVLSLGTQEQAMFALRLAFGELLASRGDHPEPQLVVLDDPLVNADPERQARAREILRRASNKLQILILTARPDDYRSLNPKEYDLAALKA